MLISIHDSSLKRMAYMDNVVPLAMHYSDDTWRRLLKEATSTFTFKVDMLGRESEQYLTDNAYISFQYNGRKYLFNIMTITPDSGSKSIIVYCENLSLELLNETKAPIDIQVSHSLEWYLNNDELLISGGLTLGINEVSDKTAKIKLESEQTGLARLTSIANNFGAELEFVTELNGDGTLKSMTVNFFKKYDGVSQGVGTYRRDLILEYGRNVDGIKRTIDKTDLYNAINPTGKDGLNITSLEKEEYDENGNLEFYTKKGNPNIFAPQSKARYRAQLLNDTDGWLRRYYSADGTSNINTLYSLALNELKKHAYPAITYEITGFYDLEIGDTVRIVDTSFTPTLIVQARVAEQSICFSDPTKNKTTFGNILALESRVSQDLTGRLKQLVEEATPYHFEIVSDNGLTFKNSEGNTTLTARVYKGSNVQEVSVDSFEWLIDGVSFGGTSKSQLVNASQVSGTAVVRYNAKINDVVIGGLEVTLQDVSDGKSGVDGNTYYPHTAWAYSADGSDGFTTTYPNLNLLDGTKDFSGDWKSMAGVPDDGTYKGLTVKSRRTKWNGIYKDYVVKKDGDYTFSIYISASSDGVNPTLFIQKNGVSVRYTVLSDKKFDMQRFSYVLRGLKVGDVINGQSAKSGDSDGKVSVAGHKWEYGAVSTPWMPSSSEVTNDDYPTYTGTYSDTNQTASNDPSKYTWTVSKGADGANGADGTDGVGVSGTFITYAQSTSGTTPPSSGWTTQVPTLIKGLYLWTSTKLEYTDGTNKTAYSVSYNAKDGNDGGDGKAGKDGVGIDETVIKYAQSTSGTDAPESGYSLQIPEVPAGNYLWTKTEWKYTDGTSEVGYSVAKMGNTGPQGDDGADGKPTGITRSDTVPTETYDGMMWQYTGIDDLPVTGTTAVSGATYVLNDDNWSAYELPKENISVAKLDDVSPIIGKVLNEFEYTALGGVVKGSVTIDKDVKFKTENTTNVNHPTTEVALSANSNFSGMMVQYIPIKGDTGHQTGYYTQSGIYLQDSVNGWVGSITSEALTNKGWKNVTGFVNGVQTDAVPLQYKVTINMDNTRTIKFRGGFKGNGTSDIPQSGIVQLPVEARPTTTLAFPCIGSGARIARIIISADGWIQFNVAAGSSNSGFNAVLLSNVFYEI